MVNKLVTGGAVVVLFLVIGYVFFGAGGGILGQFTGVGEAQEAVYVVGQNGLILKSTDGGDNWETQDSGTTERLNTVYFTSIDIGFAGGSSGTLLKTTDGGDEWGQANVNCGSIDPCNINDIHFPTSRVGYAAGWETYLKTSNGGNNWVYKMRSSYSDKIAVFFTDEDTGYLGSGRMLDKIDGDVIENLIPYGSSSPSFQDLYFTDEDTGYTVGRYGSVRKTTDGGDTWENILDISADFKSIHFTDENTGYVAGAEIVWHGSPGGSYHRSGIILRTEDAGETWEELDLPEEAYRDDIVTGYDKVPTFRSIHFISSTEGYAVGHFGTILKTEDAGSTWTVLRTAESDEWLTSVFTYFQEAEEPGESGSGEVRGAAKAFVSVTTDYQVAFGGDREIERGDPYSYYDDNGNIYVKEGDFVILSPDTDIVGDTLPSWIDEIERTYTEPTVVKWYDGDRRLRSIAVGASGSTSAPFYWSISEYPDPDPYIFTAIDFGGTEIDFEYVIGEFDTDYCAGRRKADETELSCIRPIGEDDFPPGSIIRTFGIPGGQDSAEYTLTMEATKPDGSTVLDYITVHVRKTSERLGFVGSYNGPISPAITVILITPKDKTQKTEDQLLEAHDEYVEEIALKEGEKYGWTEERISDRIEEDIKDNELRTPSLNSDAYEYTNSIFSRVNNFYEEASNAQRRFDFYVHEKSPGERYRMGHDDKYYCRFGPIVDLLPVFHREAKNLLEDDGGKVRGDIMTVWPSDCFLADGKLLPYLTFNIIVIERESGLPKFNNEEFDGYQRANPTVIPHELGHWHLAGERYDNPLDVIYSPWQKDIDQYSTMGTNPGVYFTNTFDAPTLHGESMGGKMGTRDWLTKTTVINNRWGLFDQSKTYILGPLLRTREDIRIKHWLKSDYIIEYRTNHPLVSVWERNIEPAVVVTKWNTVYDDTGVAALLTEEGDSVNIVDLKVTLVKIIENLGEGWTTMIKVEEQSSGNGAILEMNKLTYEGEDALLGYDEIDRHLNVYPNLDLHATVTYNSNEYHVGPAYGTGIYDCPSFAQCSGNSYSVEWMFFPDDAEATYYVTDHDTGALNLESPVDIGYVIQYFNLDEEGRHMTREYEGGITNNAGKYTSKFYTTPDTDSFILAYDKQAGIPANQKDFETTLLDLEILDRLDLYNMGESIIVDTMMTPGEEQLPLGEAPEGDEEGEPSEGLGGFDTGGVGGGLQ